MDPAAYGPHAKSLRSHVQVSREIRQAPFMRLQIICFVTKAKFASQFLYHHAIEDLVRIEWNETFSVENLGCLTRSVTGFPKFSDPLLEMVIIAELVV